MSEPPRLRVSGCVSDSIVDGPGMRYVVFVQGCPHHCPGCHNPQTHDFGGGYDADLDEIVRQIAGSHGGDMIMRQSGYGGLCVDLLLPAYMET